MNQRKNCKSCSHPLTKIQVYRQQTFCSRICKGQVQKKRVYLECTGCSKKFSLLPYLKRKTNYCSLRCYRDSTRIKEKRFCKECRNEFYATGPQIKKGYGIYCSRKCQNKQHKQRRIAITCKECGKIRHVSPGVFRRKPSFCSKKCADDIRRDYVQRVCKHCNRQFELPRWETNRGRGTFCSRKCFIQYKGETVIEKKLRYALQRERVKFHQEVKIGIFRADFLLHQYNLILECDGSFWHEIPGATKRDQHKDSFLNQNGYQVARIKENIIRESTVNELQNLVKQLIIKRQTKLQPSLSIVNSTRNEFSVSALATPV